MRALLPPLLLATPAPAAAPEALGLFGGWGAFRAQAPLHCYAIAEPARRAAAAGPYLTVSTWPGRRAFRAVHVRLRRPVESARIVVGEAGFALRVRGADAWPATPAEGRRIAAGLHAGLAARVEARGGGRHFADSYAGAGAASAIDAADVACLSAGR